MIPPLLPTYNRAPLAFTHGDGAWLVDETGRRFLDFASGIAVMALGHGHPALKAALHAQADALWHTSNLYEVPQQRRLAQMLVAETFADTVFFCNSGTEAGELAIKMARKHWHEEGAPGRTTVLTFEGAFHGRSNAMIAAAGSEKLTAGFGPLMPGFRQLPWGDHEALRTAAAEPDVGAIMIEPIQGESGIRPLPDPCLKGLRDLCDDHGHLLILDEIQCGMGRTGRLFAHDWAGIAPDIMMIAKGIGGGFPLAATLATERAAAGMIAGTHGSTYGGNPLGCAVGCAVMEEVTRDGFLDTVNRRAGFLRQRLEGLVGAHPDIFEAVRGQGLMLGLKCRVPNADIIKAGYAAEILTVPGGDNVVRVLPALTITEEEIAEGVDRLERAARTLSTRIAAAE